MYFLRVAFNLSEAGNFDVCLRKELICCTSGGLDFGGAIFE